MRKGRGCCLRACMYVQRQLRCVCNVGECASAGKSFPESPLPRFPTCEQVSSGAVLGTGRVPSGQLYLPADLRIGTFVSVHGRDLYLFDCDAFTRSWYKVGGGREPFAWTWR